MSACGWHCVSIRPRALDPTFMFLRCSAARAGAGRGEGGIGGCHLVLVTCSHMAHFDVVLSSSGCSDPVTDWRYCKRPCRCLPMYLRMCVWFVAGALAPSAWPLPTSRSSSRRRDASSPSTRSGAAWTPAGPSQAAGWQLRGKTSRMHTHTRRAHDWFISRTTRLSLRPPSRLPQVPYRLDLARRVGAEVIDFSKQDVFSELNHRLIPGGQTPRRAGSNATRALAMTRTYGGVQLRYPLLIPIWRCVACALCLCSGPNHCVDAAGFRFAKSAVEHLAPALAATVGLGPTDTSDIVSEVVKVSRAGRGEKGTEEPARLAASLRQLSAPHLPATCIPREACPSLPFVSAATRAASCR